MKLIKLIALVVAGLFIAVPAWAGNIPEFDAVGCDATNYFALGNSVQYGQVIANNIGPKGPINYWSAFPSNMEYFRETAGQLFPDPCFPEYLSAMTDAWNQGVYEWQIVLQMKPESDINVNIYDCVLKHNEFDVWEAADQTGRYRAPWGQLFFVPTANPIMTVTAYPGQYATPGFTSPIILDARVLPGLDLVAMDEQLYTSKALWSEGLVLALPQTGNVNASGEAEYNLKQGDMIRVTVEIPSNNTVDLFYGQDNVILKYIGIIGTWFYGIACGNT